MISSGWRTSCIADVVNPHAAKARLLNKHNISKNQNLKPQSMLKNDTKEDLIPLTSRALGNFMGFSERMLK